MKLLPNDTGENGVCNVVPPLGENRAAAWRMLMICVIYAASGAITRGHHARRLLYKTTSGRMDLIYFHQLLLLLQYFLPVLLTTLTERLGICLDARMC